MLQPSTLKFLQQLDRNNNKEWFDKNRPAYETAKADFATLIDTVITKFGKKDPAIATLTAKECVFRINRDVRFSKNKAPYKNNMGASIVQGGKKSIYAGYYFHLQPGGKSFVGGGSYMPCDNIKKIRQEIDYNWEDFKKIITASKFKKVYGDLVKEDGLVLSREPKGYEKDNPAIEYLKFKSWIAMTPVTDAELTDKNLVTKIVGAFETLQPLCHFLNTAME